jgi:hypothetical protein
MPVYGAIFAVLMAVIFTVLGSFAAQLSSQLARRPAVAAANVGAGLTFIAAGVAIPAPTVGKTHVLAPEATHHTHHPDVDISNALAFYRDGLGLRPSASSVPS